MPVFRLSRFEYLHICPTCHHLQDHLLARLCSTCNVGPLPLHISKSSHNPWPSILNSLLSVTASAGLCKVMMIGKRGHSFSVTWLNSDSFWLKHTDLSRDCFFYRSRGSIGGWVLMGVVPGQRGALLCRRRVFVLSHIWGSDQLRELCREQDCPAGCHCRKAIRQNCGNTVSVPQPGGNKWVSLTPICKT